MIKAKDCGFILKNYLPVKHQVIILNQDGECLQVVVRKSLILEKLRPGYQVQYSLVPGLNYANLVDIEIVNTPVLIDYLTLEFLHQVLELCVLAIPIGQITTGVIDIIKMVTTGSQNSWSSYKKRLLICCLLSAVGFYPEVNSVQDYNFILKISKIDATKIDSFSSFRFDVELDLLLIKWIADFINGDDASRLANLFATICQN
jgi:hypothetical protein